MPALPQWRPLDDIAAAVSEGNDSGRVVGIVASESAVASGWAEGAALTLAEAWSSAGQKVVLVDGSLQRPMLHLAVGIENGEGLSDAALFGASVARGARKAGNGFFLIPAGTAVADTNSVVRSARWDQLARGFVEAGVTLGIFLADGESGTAAFLGSASEIVVLAGRGEDPPNAVRDLEPLVSLVTGPAGAGRQESVSPVPDADPLSATALQQAAAEGRGRMRLLLLLAVILVVVLLGIFGVIQIPGITPAGDGAAPTG